MSTLPATPAVRFLALFLAACAALGTGASHAQGTVSSELGDTFLREMEAYFEAHPELETLPGSGWKPFNRIKWFRERRVVGGRLPAGDAVWKAWEAKRAMEAERGDAPMWFSLGPANFSGRMLSIDFDPDDPNVVYAGAATGGLWKTTDGGSSWTTTTDDLPSLGVGGVAVSRTNPDIVVIGGGEPTLNVGRVAGVGILRSTDRGETWSPTNIVYQPADGHGFHVMTAAPSGTFLGGAVDGLYRSIDDGVTWTQVMGTVSVSFANGWYDVQYDPEDPMRVYAVKGNDVSGNGVYVSEDDGATWSLAGTGQPASDAFGKSKLGVSGSTVYCYIGDAGFGGGVFGLIRSDDDGATWLSTVAANVPSGQSWYNLVCAADPDNPTTVFCGAVRLARSIDGGNAFLAVDTAVHVDHHAIRYQPGFPNTVWSLNDGGVYRSTVDGVDGFWQNVDVGIVTYQFYDICVNNGPDPYYVMGGTQDNGTDKWSGTTAWADGLGADGMVCNVDPTNGTTVYAEIQFGDHRKSTTSGTDFFEINSGITGTAQWVTPVDQDQRNGNRLFTETSNGIFRTTNGGVTWSNVASHRATWISISPVDPSVVWSVRGSLVRYSVNGGGIWVPAASFGFSAGSSTKILAHPTDAATAFVTFATYSSLAKVARTTDLGESWEDVSGDLPDIPVNGIVVDPLYPTSWYVGTDLGVYRTANGGAHWEPYGTGLPNTVVVDVEIKSSLRKLVAGSHGRGAWEVDLEAVVATGEVPAHPRHLMLDDPFPNPVGDRVLFRYAARTGAPVTLRIYDVRGRLVETLERFDRGDGIVRTTPWLVEGAVSGLYFAVLEADGEKLMRKVMVQR